MLHIYYCWCVDDQYLSPYQTRAKWLPWLLRKSGPLILTYMGPWGPHTFAYGVIYHCGCMDHQYLSPYQTRAKWLPWLLRKSRPFVFFIWAPGALDLHLWGQNGNTFSFLYHAPHMCKVWDLSLL